MNPDHSAFTGRSNVWYAASLALALLMTPLAATRAADDACETALVANRWQPFLALAGPSHNGAAAVNFLGQTLSLQQRVLMHSRFAPKVADLKGRVYKSLRSFDLADLYDMLPDQQPPPWHSITLSGIPTADGYQVNDVPFATIDATPAPYGAMNSQFEMQPVAHIGGPFGDRYEIKAQARLDTGLLRWPAVLDALRSGLENTSKPAPIRVTPQQIAAVQATSQYLSDYDARVLAQFAAAFPATFAWFSGIGHVADLSLTPDTATSGPYHLYIAIQLDDQALESRYPNVEDYLKRLGDFVNGNFDVSSSDGRWLNAHFDTQRRRVTMDLWVANGQPIPSNNGQPATAFIGAKIPDTLNWQTYANLRFKALGVSVTLNNWRGDWTYDAKPGGMTLAGYFNQQPGVTVTGKALNVFPVQWMEALLPINVADAVNGFMQVLAHSNGGKGAEVRVALAAPAGGDSLGTAAASGTALDNIFVRLGMAMLSHRVLPNDKQAAGLRHLINDGLNAYGKDLARMAQLTNGNASVPVPASCAVQ